MALWGGRFDGEPSELMRVFSESLSTDLLMWEEDIAGSIAHATMLGEVGLLTDEEVQTLKQGLEQVADDLSNGWVPGAELEDIHELQKAIDGFNEASEPLAKLQMDAVAKTALQEAES